MNTTTVDETICRPWFRRGMVNGYAQTMMQQCVREHATKGLTAAKDDVKVSVIRYDMIFALEGRVLTLTPQGLDKQGAGVAFNSKPKDA